MPNQRQGLSRTSKTDTFSESTPATEEAARSIVQGASKRDKPTVVKLISLSNIVLDPKNRPLMKLNPDDPTQIHVDDPLRAAKESYIEGLKELAETIKSHGVEEPIRVYRHGNTFRMIFGERRVLASRIAKMDTIPAIVDDSRPKNLRTIQADENLQREDVLPWERLMSIRDMLEENNIKIKSGNDLVKLLKKSKAMCNRYFQLLSAPEDVQDAMRSGKITSILRAYRICSIQDSQQRIQILQEGAGSFSEHEFLAKLAEITKTSKVQVEDDTSKQQKPKSRGREKTSISMGSVKDASIIEKIIKRVSPKHAKNVDWSDLNKVQIAWNDFIKTMAVE